MKLSGKTALLTGASKGLGRALALQLDANNCRLLLIGRDERELENLQEVLRTPGSRIFQCDLSSTDARQGMVKQIVDSESRLDLLIHCAGVGSHSRLDQLTPGEIQHILAVNAHAPFDLTVGLFPMLPPGEPAGIVHIGSLAGELATPGMSIYSASKAALHAFSRAVHIELAEAGHFSLLVILGALRSTRFKDSIRFPASGQPGWYRLLDVEPTDAANQIIQAIVQERTQLVIPGWYRGFLSLNRFLSPLSRAATKHAYRKFRLTDKY